MRKMLVTAGRILWMHWPALIAWTLFGGLGRHFALQLAGWVGAYTTLGGVLILPLAALSRLISLVAMFLIVRDSLANLQTLAPLPTSAKERRTTFMDALFASILPFFAVYAAWGMFGQDRRIFVSRMIESSRFEGTLGTGQADDLTLNPLTITVTLLAFAARWALKRWQDKLPRWSRVVAVYFEALWVTLFIAFVSFTINNFVSWMNSRVALVWVNDIRGWWSEHLSPLLWVWESLVWLVSQLGGLLLEPLAWLTVAGVIYGQALKIERFKPRHRIVTAASARVSRIPEGVRKRAKELTGGMTDKIAEFGGVLGLMFRSGPVLIAGYILLYTVAKAAEPGGEWLATRILGPHDRNSYWVYADILVTFMTLVALEPLRATIVASAYDATLGATVAKPHNSEADKPVVSARG